MIAFPHAKINLGLHVLRNRPDGFRDIETVLVPIPLYDALEVVIDHELPVGEVVLTRSGLPVPGDVADDLCVKAARLLDPDRSRPGLRMHLHKGIPIGAGLGGGSSDGAFALRLIDRLLDLRTDPIRMLALAAQLGSDCAFFLGDQAQLAKGRGEELFPLTIDLRGWWLMLINPGIHVPTSEVYARTQPAPAKEDLARLVQGRAPQEWPGRLVNVMETYVLQAYPEVDHAYRLVQQAGAVYTAMSGSGSSVFGLFKDRPQEPSLPSGHRAWVLPL